MADLDSKIQGRLRELCQKITVAHDLDTEIQEELYGHMEDKLRRLPERRGALKR